MANLFGSSRLRYWCNLIRRCGIYWNSVHSTEMIWVPQHVKSQFSKNIWGFQKLLLQSLIKNVLVSFYIPILYNYWCLRKIFFAVTLMKGSFLSYVLNIGEKHKTGFIFNCLWGVYCPHTSQITATLLIVIWFISTSMAN